MASRLAAAQQHARQIAMAGVRAADPYHAILRHCSVANGVLTAGRQRFALGGKVVVVGAGKATARMAQAVEELLGRHIAAGTINVKYGHTAPLRRVAQVECGHPVPDAQGVAGALQVLEHCQGLQPQDLVLVLISGGASALLPLPVPGVTLDDKRATTDALLRCGATIHEMNCVRKHLSAIKGGQLARAAAPARVLALILSDVIGDDLDVIGSGPTAPDPSTFAQARDVITRFALWDQIPAAVARHLRHASPETPKPGDALFARVTNHLVGSNTLALQAAARHAKQLGYRPLVLSSTIAGETRDIAHMHLAIARQVCLTGQPARAPLCLLSGGETTVTLRGDGKGGRNQEFVLAIVDALAQLPQPAVALSLGTDGTDGPTDAAGALATTATAARAARLGLSAASYLARNDAYHFFHRTGGLIRTGPTGTNVMDIRLILVP